MTSPVLAVTVPPTEKKENKRCSRCLSSVRISALSMAANASHGGPHIVASSVSSLDSGTRVGFIASSPPHYYSTSHSLIVFALFHSSPSLSLPSCPKPTAAYSSEATGRVSVHTHNCLLHRHAGAAYPLNPVLTFPPPIPLIVSERY